MDFDLCQAFDLDEQKIINIEEHGLIDASFCAASIIQKTVAAKNRKLVLVLHHHSFGHYQGIASKLGYNLQNLKDAGNVLVVNVMEEIRVSKNIESVLTRAYEDVSAFIKKNPNDGISIVLDHPGDTGLAFDNFPLVLNYVRMFQNLTNQPGVSLISVTNRVESRPMTVLTRFLETKSDVTLIIRGLETGSAPDISGSITIHRREFTDNKTNRLTEFHYQLLDKKVRLFAPGTVQIK